MNEHKPIEVESTLRQQTIHNEWIDKYRTPDNEQFYNMAFDFIVKSFGSPQDATVVDAGCGSCAKSKNLADRGFHVIGTDLSESALELARQALKESEYENKIELMQQNLTDMTMSDDSVDYLVCWGVLMHIPEVHLAIAEMCRIVKTGGYIAISEGNMNSLLSVGLRFLKKLLRRQREEVHFVPAGVESWEQTEEGRLMTREVNMRWLIKEFEKNGFKLQKHVAGQFTEMYWLMPTSLLKNMIHLFNRFWFRVIKNPVLAFGNILIFRKQ